MDMEKIGSWYSDKIRAFSKEKNVFYKSAYNFSFRFDSRFLKSSVVPAIHTIVMYVIQSVTTM
jgi:hypothetical protein